MRISVAAVLAGGVGLVFIWSALHGANVSLTLKDLLAGKTAQGPIGGLAGAATAVTP